MDISSSNCTGSESLASPLWKNVFHALPDGVIVTNAQFTICFANRAFGLMVGKEASGLIGRKCYDVFPVAQCKEPGCPLVRIAAGAERLENNGEHHCKLGVWLPCTVTCTAYADASGRFGGMVERIADASSLRKAQEDLHKSHERLRKTMGALIQAMSLTIEKRDPYTAGQQRRVAKLCRAIATELGFSWERIQGLRMAAAIHDLGKIHVPSAILNKPGTLSEPEMAIIRQHPQTGYEILKGIDFPWPLAETIRQHHERMNGSGYPRGLKGDAILLEARILAVADVVESIVSFRPYRPAFGVDAALTELRKGHGRLYDKKIARICEALIRDRGFDFQTSNGSAGPLRGNSDGMHRCAGESPKEILKPKKAGKLKNSVSLCRKRCGPALHSFGKRIALKRNKMSPQARQRSSYFRLTDGQITGVMLL